MLRELVFLRLRTDTILDHSHTGCAWTWEHVEVGKLPFARTLTIKIVLLVSWVFNRGTKPCPKSKKHLTFTFVQPLWKRFWQGLDLVNMGAVQGVRKNLGNHSSGTLSGRFYAQNNIG